MVLDNASGPNEPDSYQDGAPSSDNDPYASNIDGKNVTSQYSIDTSKLPRPLPLIGTMFGYNDELLSKALTQKVAKGSQMLRRPMTQEEVDAFSYWTAKQIKILSYGVPIGVGGGLWRAWTTKETFRLPFYRPNMETFNTQTFPSVRIAVLKGNNAVLAWHAIRALAYGATGHFVGQLLFGSYSMTVAAVGELGDKRLKPFVDAAKAESAAKKGSLPKTSGQPGMGQQGAGMGAQSIPQESPVSISGGEQSPDPSWGSMSEDKQPEAQPGRWPQSRPSRTPATAPAPVPVEQNSDPTFGMFDDASPTGGLGVQEDIRAAPAASQSGSAWDRIRRGEQSNNPRSGPNTGAQQAPNQGGWSRVQRDGRAVTAGASYDKTENGDLTKSEAQKEFDARVEQERRGGDIAKGSGDQKRW